MTWIGIFQNVLSHYQLPHAVNWLLSNCPLRTVVYPTRKSAYEIFCGAIISMYEPQINYNIIVHLYIVNIETKRYRCLTGDKWVRTSTFKCAV